MATSKPDCQWYQSGDVVTASLRLRPLKSNSRGEITVKFEEDHCSVFDGGVLYWECHLSEKVVPSKCRMTVGKVRADIKLKKMEPIQWTEYEVEAPLRITENGISSDLTSHTHSKVATATPVASKVSAPTFRPEDLQYVNHLPHDFYDMGRDVVKVKVQLSQLDERHCTVTFKEEFMELKFRTSDGKFLRMYEGTSPSTTFVWSVHLFGKITSESSYILKPSCLELSLKKSSPGRWKTLEASNRSYGITSINSSTNQNRESSTPNSASKNSPSVESVTNNLNDLSIDSPKNTSPAKTETRRSPSNDIWTSEEIAIDSIDPVSKTGQASSNAMAKTGQTGPKTSQTSSGPTTSIPKSSKSSSASGGQTIHYPSNPTGVAATGAHIVGSKYTKGVSPAALEVTDPSYRHNQLGKPSLTGLCNVGNSCFMSSVIQCLSNTSELRDYFIDGRYLADINKNNPLGFQGELAKCFSQIIRKLWSGEYEYFSPKKLKSVISSRSSHFGGYQQQDSHEFMSYLLDGLHEDLNRVRTKPQTPAVESDDRPDIEVAKEFWEVHKKRNDSYFVDNFQGQFKSTLVCPQCSKVSVTFDPYMSMSVPIPQNLRSLPVIFVPCDPTVMPTKYILKLSPEGNLELLKASVARKTGIPMTQLRVFEAFNGKFQSLLSTNQHPIKSIGDNDVIIVSEVLSSKSAGDKVVEINVIQRVQLPIFPTKCSTCGRLASDLLSKEGKKIQRCGQCKAVGYCDRQCQGQDWSSHKLTCRHGRPTPVGLPFVVSLPSSQLTYAKLASTAESFARRSVEVTQSEATSSEPMYVFLPVDRYGDNKDSCEPLEVKGDAVLQIESQFLAMDWRNNPKDNNSVTISPKLTLDHRPDPTASLDDQTSSNKDISLDQCLELFTEPELLSKEEAWYCSKCKEHREATKQISVWRLPRFLILHLKRFSFRNMVWRDKINKIVTFPINGLDMSPYMLGEAAIQISPDSPPLYDLYAIVNHYGAVHRGHYTAMVKPPSTEGLKDNDWLCYDDDSVFRLQEVKVQTKDAYILFYVQRDSQTVKTKL